MSELAQALQSDLDHDHDGTKRRRDENGAQVRAKRARYTSIAWYDYNQPFRGLR